MRRAVFTAAAAAALLAGCNKPKVYSTNVEITRVAVVRRDEAKKPVTTDVEFSFVECPGTQIEAIRGGKEFSECVASRKVGQKVPIKLIHQLVHDRWEWAVEEVDGCKRPPDPNDEATYKLVRECTDWTVHGAKVGFQCNYVGKQELVAKCPWFRRH